jgi:chromate reductase, NAD(P)H dehydrogenase (quinone)
VSGSRRMFLVSGSTREASTNTAVLRTVVWLLPTGAIGDLYTGLLELPAFNPDDDHEPLHSVVADLRHRIAAADAVVFCTPNTPGRYPVASKTCSIGPSAAAW